MVDTQKQQPEQQQSPPLRPLPPPHGSPQWIFKEPKEFQIQRERHVEREAVAAQLRARKMLKLTYRKAHARVLKDLGYSAPLILEKTPGRPTTLDGDPPAKFTPPPLTTVWSPPPYVPVAQNTALPQNKSSRMKTASESSRVLAVEDNRATICGEKSKLTKDAFNTFKGWGRGAGGNPWTLRQVFAEVEADIVHKKARDTRAKRGHLGADEIGRGGTRERRKMPYFERRFDHTFTPGFGDGFSMDPGGLSPSSSNPAMRTCTSLPALSNGADS